MEDLKGVYIPDELYVTFKEETNYNYQTKVREFSGILGFMSPYAQDKAFEKRQDTQRKWAYGYGSIIREGKVYTRKQEELIDIPENVAPKILKNTIQEGYRIGDSIKRTGWNGGNVVWRIQDPRGFELEISSANLSKILEFSSIENNLIKDPCIWVRLGSQNLLVPTTTELYQQIEVKSEEKKQDKISLKEVEIGNTVKLYNVDDEVIYYGLLNVVFNDWTYQMAYDDRDALGYRTSKLIQKFANNQIKKYIFKNTKTNELLLLTSPKIVQIINTKFNTKFQAMAIINNDYRIRKAFDIAFVSEKPVDLELIDLGFIEWPINDGIIFTSIGELNDTKNKRIYKTSISNRPNELLLEYGTKPRNDYYKELDYITYETGYNTYYKVILTYNDQSHIQEIEF